MALFKPVVFLAFANDITGREGILSLVKERNALKKILDQKKGQYELVVEPSATIEQIFKVFSDPAYKDRITVFHYAGHASGGGLHVPKEDGSSNEMASIEGLKGLFATQKNLDFVFLNGCSTQAQMKHVKEAGVSSIIGTDKSINDGTAIELAVQFYEQLVLKGASVQSAYNLSKDFIKTKAGKAEKTIDLGKGQRGWIRDEDKSVKDEEGFPWLLETTNPQWILSRVPKMDKGVKVFMVYDADDEADKKELGKHLKLLQRQKVIDAFDMSSVSVGNTGSMEGELEKYLNSADMVVLLISKSFMANDTCWTIMDDIIYEESVNDRKVIPVLMRKTNLDDAPFALPEVRDENGTIVERAYNLLTLPGRHRGHKFVSEYDDEDEAYTEIAKGIREGAIAYKKKHGIPIAVTRRRRPRR